MRLLASVSGGMMRITLIRHAKSSWGDSEVSDHERPLNNRGLDDAPFMGKILSKGLPLPTLALVSTARRAQETMDLILCNWSQSSIERRNLEDLYLAGTYQWRSVLQREAQEVEHVALCAHQPGVGDFAAWLCPDFTKAVPTCTVISFLLDSSQVTRGAGTLDFYDTPKNHSERC